jgi:type IV fimbrial biogenesis protein FimT
MGSRFHANFLLDIQTGGGVLATLHSQRGATLIELMIGLVITAMLFTAGAPAFSEWIQNTRIRNSAESILNGLQLARAEAVRRNSQVQFQLVGNDASWTIGCTNITTTCPDATIQSRSSTEGSATSILVTTTETDASTNAAAALAVFTDTLVFNGLGRITTTSLTAGDNATLDISNPGIDNCISDNPPGAMRCLRIVVSTGGQIRMCNPALNLTNNPQGCIAS